MVKVILLLALCAPVAAQTLDWFEFDPRVIDEVALDPVVLTVEIAGNVSGVEVALSGGGTVPLSLVGPARWEGTLTAAQVLAGHAAGDAHNVVGTLEVMPIGLSVNLVVNVRTSDMPAVPIRRIAADAQHAPHVLNIQSGDLLLGAHAPVSLVQRVYDFVDDEHDFMAFVEQVHSIHNRSFRNLRNTVQGIGLPIFDNAVAYGSSATLQGTVSYPNDNMFDLAETTNLHEIGHNWINFLDQPGYALGVPHWPLSDVAYGIMGLGSGTQGTAFPYQLIELPSGDYDVVFVGRARDFNDVELYLMGLATDAEVAGHVVFVDQNQTPVGGGTLAGPVDVVTISDVIAADGVRVPAAPAAPTNFRVATVVLSRERLLTADEMAFFDHMAVRGEAKVELPYSSGLDSGITRPFHLATDERGRLFTDIGLSTWIDVGFALGGVLGNPVLTGSGSLVGGSTVTLTLTQARPFSTTALVVGGAGLFANFKGGVLVPTTTLVVTGLPINPFGSLVLSGVWPLGLPADTTIWFQHWIIDASGPLGFTASNALAGTTPG